MPYRFGNPFTLLFAAGGALLLGLAAVTWRRRSRRVAIPLTAFLVGVGVWVLGDAVRIAAPNEAHILFWDKVAYLGIVAVTPAFFFLNAAITNRERWFRLRYVVGIAAISVVAYCVILTNSWHHLWHAELTFSPGTAPPVMKETWGPLWYVWAAYAYGIIAVWTYVLSTEFLRTSRSGLYRRQVGLILVGILVPTGANLLFTVFDVVAFDPLPLTIGVTAVSFWAAIFRYELLDIAPIARDVVLSNLDSGVVVLDADDRVVDANHRARAVLDLDDDRRQGIDVAEAFEGYPDLVEYVRGTWETTETMTVTADGTGRHYEAEVSPLEDELGTYLGRVVVFTDVTDRVQRQRALQARTESLERKNERLNEMASVVSHDLRNPLDVSGTRARHLRTLFADVDVSDETRDAAVAEIEGIERATERAATIAEDLLTISGDPGPSTGSDGATDADPAGGREQGSDGRVPLRSVAADAWETVDTGDLRLDVRGSRPVLADREDLRCLLENCFREIVEHGSTASRNVPSSDDDPGTGVDGAGESTAVVVGVTTDGFYVENDSRRTSERGRERALERGVSGTLDGTGSVPSTAEEVAEAHGWTVESTDREAGGSRIEVTLDPE